MPQLFDQGAYKWTYHENNGTTFAIKWIKGITILKTYMELLYPTLQDPSETPLTRTENFKEVVFN